MTEDSTYSRVEVNVNLFDIKDWDETKRSKFCNTVRYAIEAIMLSIEKETSQKEAGVSILVGKDEYVKPENSSRFEPRVVGRHAASVDANRRISDAIEFINNFKSEECNKLALEQALTPFTLRVGQLISDLKFILLYGALPKATQEKTPLDKRGD